VSVFNAQGKTSSEPKLAFWEGGGSTWPYSRHFGQKPLKPLSPCQPR
jgi:hypothetical protein